MPEISIIVPNYNTEKYLPRCIESLVNQTFKDIEIIIIDDGSTDHSVSVVKKYQKKDPRIKLFTQKNAGPGAARNVGLKHSHGKYLMFCDSDDWYESNMCEIMYQVIKKNKCDCACCQNFFDYEENVSTELKKQRVVEDYFNPALRKRNYLSKADKFKIPVCLWQKIFKKSLITQAGLSFSPTNKQDDTIFWYQFCLISQNIYYLPVKLYHYFIRDNSIATQTFVRNEKNKRETFQVAVEVFNFCQKKDLIQKCKKEIAQIFLMQLNFMKTVFTLNEMIEYKNKSNDYLKKLHMAIFVFSHQFVLFFHSPCVKWLKFKRYVLFVKSNIGTKHQREKRRKKICELSEAIQFFERNGISGNF